MNKYSYFRTDIIVIDDLLLTNTPEQDQKNLIEVFDEISSSEKSLILSSQMISVERHKNLDGEAIADAILDRGKSMSYKKILEEDSLRKNLIILILFGRF
ncbi:ATP-binding protein [Macrococcus epidermidis]|nr:ATP-binding protein [Macrococcus epidermidis]